MRCKHEPATPRANRRERQATIAMPVSKKVEISRNLYAVAIKRTAHLQRLTFHDPIRDVVASAYLQGLTDAIDVLTNRGAP